MFKVEKPVQWISLLKKTIIIGVLGYCTITTFLLLRLKPDPILIGIDAYGTRLIVKADDSLLKIEKENFIKKFLSSFYNYDQDNFSARISESGDLMSRALWEKKRQDLAQTATRLKSEILSQTTKIQELRQIDDVTFEADLLVLVKDKLKEYPFKLRVELKLKRSTRTGINPYAYELEVLNEQQLS